MIIIAGTQNDSFNEEENILFVNAKNSDEIFDKYDEVKFNYKSKKDK